MAKFIILQGTNPGNETLPTVGSDDTVLYYDITDRKLKKVDGNGPSTQIESGWKKAPSIAYTAFLTATGGTNVTVSIGDNLIPAGALVTGVKVKHSTRFSAVTLTTASTLSILDESGTSYISSFDVFQAPGATLGAFNAGGSSNTAIPNHTSNTNLRARLVMSGITADINMLSGITQGVVDVWYRIDRFPV